MTAPTGPQDGNGAAPAGGYQPPTQQYAQQYAQPGQPYTQPAPGQPYAQPGPGQQYAQPGPPYAQPAPGQPYTQPAPGQWGWGGQQGPGQVPPAQAQSPKGGHTLRNVLIGVCAVVLVAAAGLVFVLHGRSGGTMKIAWTVSAPQTKRAGTDPSAELSGTWITPTGVVDGRADGIIDYSLKNGAQVWGWQAPSGTKACAMSPTTSDGIGVLAYGKDSCDQLMAFKLDTGQQLWPKAISVADPRAQSGASMAVDNGVMAVRGPGGVLQAYDLASGKKLWQASGGNPGDDCDVVGTVVGNTVYGLYGCTPASGGLDDTYHLLGYDARSGAKTWTGQLSQVGTGGSAALRSDPANGYLFVKYSSDDSDPRLLCYSVPKGSGPSTPTTVIKLDDYEVHYAFAGGVGQAQTQGYAIHGHTLYIQGPTTTQGSRTNNVNAVDLTTGKKLWTKAIAGDMVTIVDADADGVHAVASKDGEAPFQLVTFSASTGDESDGASTDDDRLSIQTEDRKYLESGYLIILPATPDLTFPALEVLSGAKLS